MGEAKARRARYTMDGGPPSPNRVAMQVEVFDPRQAADDSVHRTAVEGIAKRIRRRPAPLCTTCDYEFSHGEWPAAAYCMRALTLKSENFSIISGMICSQCVKRPPNELLTALADALRRMKPDIVVAEGMA
jgi:hypothetical protein